MYGYFSMHCLFEALWRLISICDPYRRILDTMAEQGSRRAAIATSAHSKYVFKINPRVGRQALNGSLHRLMSSGRLPRHTRPIRQTS